MVPANPFSISLLAADGHFADREVEVARLERALREAGGKLILYGDRRLGKSSALEFAALRVRQAGGRAAIASLATATDPAEAAQRVLSAVQHEAGRSWRELLERIAARLDLGFEVTPSTDPGSLPTLRFTFGAAKPGRSTKLLPDVLDAINAQMQDRGVVLGLGLDEFQRIHEWGGEDAEWALREALQRHRSLAYVLAGSRRGLIESMIGGKGRALWKLADVLPMGPIEDEILAEWIVDRSTTSGVPIRRAAALRVVRLARPRTRDVVQLARAAWFHASVHGDVAEGDVGAAFEKLVDEQAELYRTIWSELTAREQSVLRAFAAEPTVQITAAAAIGRYRLGPKSSVQTAVARLVDAEHLARHGVGDYRFDDPFFRRWVQRYGLPDIGMPVPPLMDSD